MTRYARTETVGGCYAVRCGDGLWYVFDDRTGKATGETATTRRRAVLLMGVTR